MNSKQFFLVIVMALILTVVFGIISISVISFVDTLTLKNIGEENVPCLDKYNRPFEDEMCTKVIRCSWLGFVVDKQCVSGGKDEQ